ncbi:hypothetical protein MKW92_004213 [Papaver armeniacum]|nr:hypothetical protein MKW92_004213 [Papaver armeniacum]
MWEHTPGTPKDDTNTNPTLILSSSENQSPVTAPKLPPGRVLEIKRREPPEKKESKEQQPNNEETSQDTLSRSESFFFNCSMSGVSGLDGWTDAKPPSGTFSSDLKTRDFMMGRFLPAAKAMASDTPQQLPRVLVNEENAKYCNLLQITPYAEPKFAEDISEDDYSEAGDSLSKGCGLFPRLCSRSSACLLNPIPGMKVRGLDEKSPNAHKCLVCWSGSQTTEGSRKNGLSGDGGISPHRNEATRSTFREGAGFLGVPNQVVNSKDTRFNLYTEGSPNKVVSRRGTGSMSPAAEKTLYIDSGLFLEAPNSSSSSSDFKDNNSQICGKKSGDGRDFSCRIGSVSDPKSSDFVSGELNFSTDRSNHEDNVEVLKKGNNADDEARFLVRSNAPAAGSLDFDKPELVSTENEGNLSLVCFLAPLPPPLPKSPSEFSNDAKWETIVKTSYVNNSNVRLSERLKKPAMQ